MSKPAASATNGASSSKGTFKMPRDQLNKLASYGYACVHPAFCCARQITLGKNGKIYLCLAEDKCPEHQDKVKGKFGYYLTQTLDLELCNQCWRLNQFCVLERMAKEEAEAAAELKMPAVVGSDSSSSGESSSWSSSSGSSADGAEEKDPGSHADDFLSEDLSLETEVENQSSVPEPSQGEAAEAESYQFSK